MHPCEHQTLHLLSEGHSCASLLDEIEGKASKAKSVLLWHPQHCRRAVVRLDRVEEQFLSKAE